MKKIFYIIPFFLLLFGCEKEPINQADKVVVEAYLFRDEPVDDIRVTTLLAYGGTDTVAQPVNNLEIDIIWRNQAYRLQGTNDSGYYHYPGNDLKIEAGEVYELRFEHKGIDVSALTFCPAEPQNVFISQDTLEIVFFSLIDSFLTGGNITPPDPDSVVVSWPNPNNEYFYVVAENIEPVKEPIFPDFIVGLSSFFFQSQPTTNSSYEFFDFDFRHFGRHEIKVYKVNQEYVDLYTSFNQDSRTQAEPLTNIVNGLGIFTAVNYKTVPLFVTKD